MFGLSKPPPPPAAIRATVLRIDDDGSAVAKPLAFERRRAWEPIIIPRRDVRQLGLRRGELLDLALDAAGRIRHISRVFR